MGKADSIAEVSLKRLAASKEQTRGWFPISISFPVEPINAPYWVSDVIRGLVDAVPQFLPFFSLHLLQSPLGDSRFFGRKVKKRLKRSAIELLGTRRTAAGI